MSQLRLYAAENIMKWIRRFAIVYVVAFAAIALGQYLLRGHDLEHAATQGLIWAAVSATLFVATQIYRSRRCALCRDTGEPPPA